MRQSANTRRRTVNGTGPDVFSGLNPVSGLQQPLRGGQNVQTAGGVVVLVLAAGLARRFGGDKLAAALPDGRPVGAATLARVGSAWPRVVCVVRPGTEMVRMAQAAGVYCVECPEAVDGMGVSLAAGIRASADAAGWVVALADMPFVDPVTIRRVAQAIEAGADVAAPFWRGERGHPVGFHRRLGPELAGLTGDEGARQVLARYRSSLLRIDVDDPGVLRDIDVPADLDAADEVSNPPGDRP